MIVIDGRRIKTIEMHVKIIVCLCSLHQKKVDTFNKKNNKQTKPNQAKTGLGIVRSTPLLARWMRAGAPELPGPCQIDKAQGEHCGIFFFSFAARMGRDLGIGMRHTTASWKRRDCRWARFSIVLYRMEYSEFVVFAFGG